jgi:acyl-coenzyme A synthetase/AMP-(fatty) acid ligase
LTRPPDVDALLSEQARRFGDRVYLECVDPPGRLTFAQLDAGCHRVAHFLAGRGVRANERVTLLGDNSPAFVMLFFGILRYGATVNPLNAEVLGPDLPRILYDVAPRLIFWDRALGDQAAAAVAASGVEAIVFDELMPRLGDRPASPCPQRVGGPSDVAVLDYTSGTTAAAKGVALTHDAFAYGCDGPARRFDFRESDRVLEYRSLAWASPQLLSLGGTLQTGTRLVLARKFSHHQFFDWIRDQRVSIVIGVPTVINMLLDRPLALTVADFPGLRFMTSSSAPLSVERQLEFEDRYSIPIVQGCGMTEAGWMAGNPPDARRPGSVGPPMPHVAASIRSESGAPCRPGEEGELVVSGPQMASAYLTARDRLEPIPQDGFFTGDLARIDADGYLYITGRKKEVIIRGGVNVAAAEITTALLAHAAVTDAATIGVPDAVYGEAIVSFVAPRPGHRVTPAEMQEHCGTRLAAFKVPAHVIVVDAIPKTERGKVARRVLEELWRQRGARSVP